MKRWTARTLASVLLAFVMLLVAESPAFAALSCNNFVVASGNTFSVCVEKINNGYNAVVYHGYGPLYIVDFNLATNEGQYGDYGEFYIAAGQTRTYFFAVGYKQWAYTLVYWRSGSPYFSPMFSPVVY